MKRPPMLSSYTELEDILLLFSALSTRGNTTGFACTTCAL